MEILVSVIAIFIIYKLIAGIMSYMRNKRIKKTFENTEEIKSRLGKIEKKLEELKGKNREKIRRINMSRFHKGLADYNLGSRAFIYLLGSYQAVTTRTRQPYFKITARTPSLEAKLRTCFEKVFRADFSWYRERTGRLSFRACSVDLMSLLNEITEGNARIPLNNISLPIYDESHGLAYEYLRGFFDQRATTGYDATKIKGSEIIRNKPSIQIAKKASAILEELVKLLESLKFSPTLTKCISKDYAYYKLRMRKRKDIVRAIKIPLFHSKEKLEKLRQTYYEIKQLMKEDKYGALGKRMKKARQQKLAF